jgi:hypothetical protein
VAEELAKLAALGSTDDSGEPDYRRFAHERCYRVPRDVMAVIDHNPDLLGGIVETAPARFRGLLTDAIAQVAGRQSATDIARTLISTSVGLNTRQTPTIGISRTSASRFACSCPNEPTCRGGPAARPDRPIDAGSAGSVRDPRGAGRRPSGDGAGPYRGEQHAVELRQAAMSGSSSRPRIVQRARTPTVVFPHRLQSVCRRVIRCASAPRSADRGRSIDPGAVVGPPTPLSTASPS